MTPRPRIRLATREDAATLAELRVALFAETAAAGVPDPARFLEDCRAAFVEFFEAERGLAFVAQAEGPGIVSALTLFVHARLPSPQSAGTEEGYVSGVYTLPAWRRRGLARALLGEACAEARRRGWTRLRLRTTAQGRGLYTAVGFQPRDDLMEFAL